MGFLKTSLWVFLGHIIFKTTYDVWQENMLNISFKKGFWILIIYTQNKTKITLDWSFLGFSGLVKSKMQGIEYINVSGHLKFSWPTY